MDIAEMIVLKSQDIYKREIEQRKLQFVFNFNSRYSYLPRVFSMMHDGSGRGSIVFNGSSFTLSETSVCMVVNEMMKMYFLAFSRPIRCVYINVYNTCNPRDTLLSTRIPCFRKPINQRDMFEYDIFRTQANEQIVRTMHYVWTYVETVCENMLTKTLQK